MVSEKRLIANKRNSRLGGVKTPQGKEVSKYNAQKHGILRQTLTEYEGDFYSDVLRQIEDYYSPANILEAIFVERIALCYIKLWRAQKSEAEFIKSRLHPRVVRSEDLISVVMRECDQVVESEGYTPQISEENVAILYNIYARYETTLENRLYRAVHELERRRITNWSEKGQRPPHDDD